MNGLLSLGAFLILASGTVISTINPTQLGPNAHFASTIITTLLFYLAGIFVRQKLALPRTGAVLLAIGAAFIPLTIWTLGQERLHWERDAIWLVAALVCLPIYLGSHLLLRDRTFALLTALAGGAELYALLSWLQVPIEWRACALLLLAARYLTLDRSLRARWDTLAWALAWTAQVAVPLIVGTLLLGRFLPAAWTVATGAEPGFLFGKAVAVACWLGVGYYALCARRLTGRAYPFIATWGGAGALLLSLGETPLPLAWHNVALALLALGALLWGRLRQRALVEQARPAFATILRQPAYQLALVLPFFASLWPWQHATSRIATLSLLALLAWIAFRSFRRLALRYAAAYLPAVALGFSLDELGRRGVPGFDPAWQNLGIAAIVLTYLLVGRFLLGVGRARPARYDALLEEPTYQVVLLTTVLAGLWPLQILASRVPTLFALAGVYALAAWLFQLTFPRAVAAMLLPLAVGYGLQLADQTPALAWLTPWHGPVWALLAGGYLLFARVALRAGSATGGTYRYTALLRDPLYVAILPLTAFALFATPASAASRLVTALALAAVYGAATILLRQRAWAWPTIAFLPFAAAQAFDLLYLTADTRPLAWTGVAAALLVGAEFAVRRTGEGRQALLDTITGVGTPRMRFAAPLFAFGHGTGALALGSTLWRVALAPVGAAIGAYVLPVPILTALFTLVAILLVSTATRRASLFLWLASALFLLPCTSAVALVARNLGFTLTTPDMARLLALLALGYAACALATERRGIRFGAPLWLIGYGLAAAAPALAWADRAATVQTLGLAIVLSAASAWLAHHERHRTFAALVRSLLPGPNSTEHETVRAFFVYVVTWLFPVWCTLTLGLWSPAPAVYGLAFALLAPLYALSGRGFGGIRTAYRWPWYLCGYTLAALGPLYALPDPTLRIVALALSIGLWIGSAATSRRAAWLYPVALLTPFLGWEIGARLALTGHAAGLLLLGLSGVYAIIGTILHRGWRSPLGPIRGRLSGLAWPFFGIGQALAALGLTFLAFQGRPLLIAGFLLGAALYAGLGWVLRQPAFGWPVALTATVAYAVGLTLTPLATRHYGLALLPLLFAALLLADTLRQLLDDADPVNARRSPALRLLIGWATPAYTLAYGGTFAALALSQRDADIRALGWWGVAALYALSVALFRRPIGLYPALGTLLAALIATIKVLVPEIGGADLLALLLAPASLLTALADAVADRRAAEQDEARRSWPLLGAESLLNSAWATLPLVYACGTLILGTLGSATDAHAGLLAAGAGALLLAVVATRWRGEGEAAGALALGALAFGQALRLADTPLNAQAPRWAAFALALTIVASVIPALGVRALAPWRRPLACGAIIVAAGALLLGLLLALLPAGQQSLAFTLALTGLTLVLQGFERRERLLGYAGVACLGVGYMVQLVIFEVGQPQAFVLPVGLYLLLIAYLEWRRGTGAGIKAALEASALTLLLAISAIQTLGFLNVGYDRHLYGTFMLLEAAALFALGAALHWKRIFLGGAGGGVLAIGILLIDPLRDLSIWYLAAILGFTMIVLVIFIERQRQQIPLWLGAWRTRLEAWD